MARPNCFRPPHLLLPRADTDLQRWSVIACDQYTSDLGYWERVADQVGDAPSTLHLIFPEVFLGRAGKPERIARIQATMRRYLAEGLLRDHAGAVLVERTLPDGRVRRGLMLELDLEHYDYAPTSISLIRPTEGTIVERIAPRVEVRQQGAELEVPHILVLIDDPQRTVIEPLAAQHQRLQPLYDTPLMQGGGRVAGRALDADANAHVVQALQTLGDGAAFAARHSLPRETPPMLFVVGDGNHSLATAKACWDRIKDTAGSDHPARWALVEVENKRGHSKEQRSDCPLVTLAMALDGSGFPRRSRVFAGNASEPATLKDMLTGLGAPHGATVVMDAGIATEANLTWLRAQGYHYVVVSKLRERQFDPALATAVQSAGQATIKIQRVLDAQGHALLYCHSPAREQKDRAIDAAKTAGFEAVLLKLQAGLSNARGTHDVAKIMERIGRAKQRYSRAAQHYQVDLTKDDTGTRVRAITWTKRIKPGSAAAHPGVYCLRTTLVELDNATLWRTYSMLTNLESVFRSLKTDLGLRPVFHQIDRRVEGHLFISVLAYHFVHTLRLRLKAQGIDDSWETLRETLATQQRVTATMQRRDGRAVHVRKATRPEPRHQKINQILGHAPNPGGTHRVLV